MYDTNLKRYSFNWLNDTCEILNIKCERVIELINGIDKQIYNEMYTEIENMKNMNSKFHAKQQLKHLINNNK